MTNRRMPWLTACAFVAGASPTFLAILSQWTRLPGGVHQFVFAWTWGLGALVTSVLAVAALLMCPWRATSKAATWSGWSAVVAAVSVLPLTTYALAHWSQHSRDEVVGIFRAGGIVRDMTFQLVVLAGSMLFAG